MRCPGLLALALAAAPGCSRPNHEFGLAASDATTVGSTTIGASTVATAATTASSLATDPTSADGSGTASESGVGPTATTATESASAGTDPSTTSTSDSTTDATTTTTTTTDGATTNDLPVCQFQATSALSFSVKHQAVPDCNLQFYNQYVEAVGVSGDTWKIRRCSSPEPCIDPNTVCAGIEELLVTFTTPPQLNPVLYPKTCYLFSYLGGGAIDANTCSARVLRFAKTGEFLPTSVYVGAVGTPKSDALPGPWPPLLEFKVGPDLALPCDGAACMGFAPGTYDLNVTTLKPVAQLALAEGTSAPATLHVVDPENNVLDKITGEFHDVRSRVIPGDECKGHPFDWAWLADELAP